MTVSGTIYDTINDNWGNGGYGGDLPSIYNIEDPKTMRNLISTDIIEVRQDKEDPTQWNDTYTNRFYEVDVYITSKTSAAQLKLLVDEAEYLVRNTTMTGLQFVNIRRVPVHADIRQAKFSNILTVKVVSMMSSGAVTPASTTGYNWHEANMITSTYAAWVSCPFSGGSPIGKYDRKNSGQILNVDDTDMTYFFDLPQPTTKGTLKLYISGTKYLITDADANDYVTNVKVWGANDSTVTTLDTDTTDRTSAGLVTDTYTAIDCSAYNQIFVEIECSNQDAEQLDLYPPMLRCYYDT